MILISLMLAATQPPAAGAEVVQRREPVRMRPNRASARSKRVVELEAAVRSVSYRNAETRHARGPKGM